MIDGSFCSFFRSEERDKWQLIAQGAAQKGVAYRSGIDEVRRLVFEGEPLYTQTVSADSVYLGVHAVFKRSNTMRSSWEDNLAHKIFNFIDPNQLVPQFQACDMLRNYSELANIPTTGKECIIEEDCPLDVISQKRFDIDQRVIRLYQQYKRSFDALSSLYPFLIKNFQSGTLVYEETVEGRSVFNHIMKCTEIGEMLIFSIWEEPKLGSFMLDGASVRYMPKGLYWADPQMCPTICIVKPMISNLQTFHSLSGVPDVRESVLESISMNQVELLRSVRSLYVAPLDQHPENVATYKEGEGDNDKLAFFDNDFCMPESNDVLVYKDSHVMPCYSELLRSRISTVPLSSEVIEQIRIDIAQFDAIDSYLRRDDHPLIMRMNQRQKNQFREVLDEILNDERYNFGPVFLKPAEGLGVMRGLFADNLGRESGHIIWNMIREVFDFVDTDEERTRIANSLFPRVTNNQRFAMRERLERVIDYFDAWDQYRSIDQRSFRKTEIFQLAYNIVGDTRLPLSVMDTEILLESIDVIDTVGNLQLLINTALEKLQPTYQIILFTMFPTIADIATLSISVFGQTNYKIRLPTFVHPIETFIELVEKKGWNRNYEQTLKKLKTLTGGSFPVY
jgi:hypothetical protein